MRGVAKFFVPLSCVRHGFQWTRAAGKINIHYMALSLSKCVKSAAMIEEVGGFLVTHFPALQRYSRCTSAGLQNNSDRKDEHNYMALSLSKYVNMAAMIREVDSQ